MRPAKYLAVVALNALCVAADRIPSIERNEGKFHYYGHGDWGHRWKWFNPSVWSVSLDVRWQIGFWAVSSDSEPE